jgi:hypothetical protein
MNRQKEIIENFKDKVWDLIDKFISLRCIENEYIYFWD